MGWYIQSVYRKKKSINQDSYIYKTAFKSEKEDLRVWLSCRVLPNMPEALGSILDTENKLKEKLRQAKIKRSWGHSLPQDLTYKKF
jgi:hypothetical protein